MTKRHADVVSSHRRNPNEPLLTFQQANIAIQTLSEVSDMFVEELSHRMSEEDMDAIHDKLAFFGSLITESVTNCFYHPNCATPHPETLSDLRERFTAGEAALVGLFQSHNVTLDEGAQMAFKASYKHVCHRIEQALTYGKDASAQASHYLM